MLQQKVQSRSLEGFRGIILILAVIASVLIGSVFFSLLERSLGTAASLGFILYGCAIAWFLLTRFVMGFIYTCTDSCLRVCRTYGKRERFMCDIWLNGVLAYGSLEDVRQRFPNARVCHATKPQCVLAPLALAHKDGDKIVITVIQPNDDLRSRLMKALKRR